MKAIFTAFIFSCILCGLSACSSSNSVKSLVHRKCTTCHSISTVCKHKGQGKVYWNRTVDQMIRLQARLNKDEQKTIVGFLAHPESLAKICGEK